MTGWIILAVLVTLAVAGPRYGVDSRAADGWIPGGVRRRDRGSRTELRAEMVPADRVLAPFTRRPAAWH